MADLTKIEVHINTSDIEDAGTDGSVYLGICGREFRCDTSADDFERGSNRTYIFGVSANVRNAASNEQVKQFARAIPAAVVDEDDLERPIGGAVKNRVNPRHQGVEVFTLIVNW